MTKFLWTGESEYCLCGHHVTDHTTQIMTMAFDGRVSRCSNETCKCHEFKPYGSIEVAKHEPHSEFDFEIEAITD
jgi:hypothetical protein